MFHSFCISQLDLSLCSCITEAASHVGEKEGKKEKKTLNLSEMWQNKICAVAGAFTQSYGSWWELNKAVEHHFCIILTNPDLHVCVHVGSTLLMLMNKTWGEIIDKNKREYILVQNRPMGWFIMDVYHLSTNRLGTKLVKCGHFDVCHN